MARQANETICIRYTKGTMSRNKGVYTLSLVYNMVIKYSMSHALITNCNFEEGVGTSNTETVKICKLMFLMKTILQNKKWK